MAIYEYQCDDCKSTFETHERVSEHDDEARGLPACPECESVNTHRVYARFFAKTSSKT
jgi:putative FmdB family regulatory protein